MAKPKTTKPRAKKRPVKKPKTKPKTKPKAKRAAAKKRSSSKTADRIDKVVEAQKASIGHVAEFVQNVGGLATKGNFSPQAWVTHYTTLLEGLSDDLAAGMKAFLKD